ncbi:MAG: calcium/sodium antiporter [bacterium]
MLTVLFLFGGIVVIYFGAEILIKGSTDFALKLGVKPIIVGLTFIAFGTSSPELFVGLNAAVAGNSIISLGNIIGSNICNIALILGLAAFISPMNVESAFIKKELPILIAVTLLLTLLLIDKELGRIDGAILLTALFVHMYMSYSTARKEKNKIVEAEFSEEYSPSHRTLFQNVLYMIGGIGLLVIGSYLFVDGATKAGAFFGLNGLVIGLTFVAVGTSLPELATSVVSAFKKENDIAISNIVGSNIFNILGVLGIIALINPIDAASVKLVDYLVMIEFTLILYLMTKTGALVVRISGAVLLLGYLAYIFSLLFSARI